MTEKEPELPPTLQLFLGCFRTIILASCLQLLFQSSADPLDPAAVELNIDFALVAGIVIQALGGASICTGTVLLLFGPPSPRAGK